MTTKTEQYSNYTFARIGKQAIQLHPTRINSKGKYLDDPDFDQIDLYSVCPRCGIQGMALTNDMRPPLKGKKRRRRARQCLFCGISTIRYTKSTSPLLNIDELPGFDPHDMSIYAEGVEKIWRHEFEEDFGPTPMDEFGD